ncbi:hypothetical protein C1H46_025724 [Malus baccata]|uniref:Uncharacterized protein n=1 Tax=Malus baccata TaxID=106549 RepID=A0A540LQE6_MALBA|nr:hypothetical protein C1H46_025724 [Malus baccata]
MFKVEKFGWDGAIVTCYHNVSEIGSKYQTDESSTICVVPSSAVRRKGFNHRPFALVLRSKKNCILMEIKREMAGEVEAAVNHLPGGTTSFDPPSNLY